MTQAKDPALGINSWLEDELYHQYQFDRKSVDEGWSHLFQDAAQNGDAAAPSNGGPGTASAVAEPKEVANTPPYGPETPRQEPPERIPPEREPPERIPPQQEPPQEIPPT